MNDIIEEVVQLGIDRAQCRRPCPTVLRALRDLEWTEVQVARAMGLAPSTISHWYTGVHHIPQKHWDKLYLLLDATLERYDECITALRDRDQWGESAAYRMRYKLGNGRGTLTRHQRRRYKMKLHEAA